MLSAHFATRTCLTTIVYAYAVATERLASWGRSIKRRRRCTLCSPCLTKSELSTFPVGNRFLMLNFDLNIPHRQQKALTLYTSIGLVNTAPNSDTLPQNFFAVIDCQVGAIPHPSPSSTTTAYVYLSTILMIGGRAMAVPQWHFSRVNRLILGS